MLVVPVFGVVDSMRAQQLTDTLLAATMEKQSRFALIDISGVYTVDTASGGHLLNLAMAAKLLGATCILTGVQPDVAQTLVSLGIDLSTLPTRRNLQDGLQECLRRMGKLSR
ncbi:STAS domain-containing protein [Polyangium sp. 6x1]|uniref:STAS domain-containing protein n=1 Tax=Polyangium sp. 6x1 TaxID=3042689 RepID=UPI00248313FB|nr:STAS domain-containing protein [Polyangium sp. 6x1]MDI1445945.1 STAS domain-containing protein [Polyangium sp. 6x1]